MKLSEILIEGISDKVYHYTDVHSALNIIQKDRFELSTSYGTKAERDLQSKDNVFYYMSTTRTLTGRYHQMVGSSATMLNLNGRKLGQRYYGKPIDYWGPEFRSVDPRKESEDRLFSDKPTIENAKSYIDEVHIYLNTDRSVHDSTHRATRSLIIECKKNNIPVFLYDNESSWLLQDKRKTVKYQPKKLYKRDQYYRGRDKGLAPYIELFMKNSRKSLSEKADKLRYSLMWDSLGSFERQLNNVIHNNRSKVLASRFDKLMVLFRKHGLSNISEVTDYLKNKWKSIES